MIEDYGIYATRYVGEQRFNDARHLTNIMNYLFSQTVKHQRNDKTIRNYVTAQGYDGTFNTQPDILKSRIQSLLSKELEDPFLLSNDLFYVNFALVTPEGVFSNFICSPQPDVLEVTDLQGYEDTANHLFNGNADNLNTFLVGLSAEHDGIMEFDDAPIEARKRIEMFIQGMALPDLDRMVLSISHSDQSSPYHVHRILRRSGSAE